MAITSIDVLVQYRPKETQQEYGPILQKKQKKTLHPKTQSTVCPTFSRTTLIANIVKSY